MEQEQLPQEQPPEEQPPEGQRGSLVEIALLFLKLGVIGFGGPAAHIALMRDEAVKRRKWLSDQHFLDLVGASHLIPGPSSTEVGMFLGYVRAGWRGLVVAGVCFIGPAAAIVLALAWAYMQYGSTPQAAWLLYGIKPVVIAIVAQAIWGLTGTAVKNVFLALLGLAALAVYLGGIMPLVALLGAGVVALLARGVIRLRPAALLALVPIRVPYIGAGSHHDSHPFSLTLLFLTFLKIGAVLFGSGYVLLAFLRGDFVKQLGWLTDRQLIDAVTIGQVTPGPVFTTATFIGYVLGGFPGAVVATIGIFLPAFALVALVYPLIPRIRKSPWMSAFLDGVNVGALGLMAAVTWQLLQSAVVDPLTAALALISVAILIKFRPNSALLIGAGALVGVLSHVIHT